ncbi:MAG: gamma-butyrobetaine hydroxylase-like domain-containing protein [Ramlibacter sp.]
MAGLRTETPLPQSITLHGQSRVLEVGFADGSVFRLPFELMRVCSPSAEVQGHGPGQEVLQTGKREVTIEQLEPVGNYGVKPTFSDGHDSGIFSWDFLWYLGTQQEELWQDYLQRLAAAGVDRDAPMPAKGAPGGGHACGSH